MPHGHRDMTIPNENVVEIDWPCLASPGWQPRQQSLTQVSHKCRSLHDETWRYIDESEVRLHVIQIGGIALYQAGTGRLVGEGPRASVSQGLEPKLEGGCGSLAKTHADLPSAVASINQEI